MAGLRLRKSFCLLLCYGTIICLTVTCLYYIDTVSIRPFETRSLVITASVVQNVNTSRPRPTLGNQTLLPPVPCDQAKISNLEYPVCVYTSAEDIYISKAFSDGGYWEEQYVRWIMKVMEADPRFVFVDLGANIGAYTLAVAHLKRHVIAVEPNLRTVQLLAQSVYLGGVSGYVTLLNNAVSDGHTTLRMGQHLTNRGGAYLLDADNCTKVCK